MNPAHVHEYDLVHIAPDTHTIVFACHICGALVQEGLKERHSIYHDEVNREISYLKTLAVETNRDLVALKYPKGRR